MANDEYCGSTWKFMETPDLDSIYLTSQQNLRAILPISHSSFEKFVILSHFDHPKFQVLEIFC